MKKTIMFSFIKWVFTILLMVEGLSSWGGSTYYVAKTGDDATTDGSNPETPYATLKAALGVAQKGDKIKIVGTITLPKTKADLQLTVSGVELFGDGSDKSCLDFKNTDGGTSGFLKLTEGSFVHDLQIYRSRNNAGVINTAAGQDSVVVSNCWINGNYFTTGGSPAGNFSAGLVTHCIFTDNSNNNSGGPILTLSGTAVMRNSIFTGNTIKSNLRGPLNGVINLSGNAAMDNCVVYGNRSKASEKGDTAAATYRPRNGGGIHIPSGSPVIRNSIIRDNLIPLPYMENPGETDIYTATVESDFYILSAANPTIENCNIPEGQIPECAVGCQSADPKFVDPDNTTANLRDFSPAEDSPCIDAGLFQDWHLTATDFALNNRFQGCSVDIGAYEFVAPLPNLVIVPNKESYEGAQEVLLTAKSDNDVSFPNNTRFIWKINGAEVEDETSYMLPKFLEIGTYKVEVEVASCSYFKASVDIEVKEVKGVSFDVVKETPGVGRKKVKFTPYGTLGLTFAENAAFYWYVNDENGEGEAVSTEKEPEIVFDEPGQYSVLLKVINADGNGNNYQFYISNIVTVEEPVFAIELSETAGEGRTPIILSAKVEGFEPSEEATYEWRWTNLDSETPDMAGEVVTNAFYAGTYSVRLVLKNADGEGLSLTNTLTDAISILPGADFYVSAKGDDVSGFGSKSKPYATLAQAVKNAVKGQKIKIVGEVTEPKFVIVADGIEIFGDGPQSSIFHSGDGSDFGGTCITLKGGAFIHSLKISGARNNGGVIRIAEGESDVVVSNCWIAANNFSTAGNPGGGFNAGLVTHCLFSGNRCNFGPVVSIGGNAKVRNSIFTGNYISSNGTAQERLGIIRLSDSAVFENNTVYGNYSQKTVNTEHHSAGLYIRSGSPTIRNNIVSYNFIHGAIGSETAVESNYLCKDGATPVATHNASSEGFGENAVTMRPTFANLDMSLAAENRDFSLAEDSSCIDRGVATPGIVNQTDYAGNLRVQGWAVDIGAYEADGKTLFFDIAAQANVVTGAQSVAFSVTGDTAYIPETADIRWFVDGEQAEARGASVSLPLEEGYHDIAVDLGGFHYVEKKAFIWVKTPEAVVITTQEVQGNGKKFVTFTANSRGFELDPAAQFQWYWNSTGEGEVAAVGNPVEAVFRPGSYDAFVRVTNADGEGAVFTTNLLNAVTVDPMSAEIKLSSSFGEGSKTVIMSAISHGFNIEADAVCRWTWKREEDNETGSLVGNPVNKEFLPGIYSFTLTVENADGDGAEVVASLERALHIYESQNVVIEPGKGKTPVFFDQLGDIPFKTVNGRPIKGAGDMTVVSSDSYRAVEDVSDYGAVGDGKTDDTAAIMAALEAAYASGKPLYFPRTAGGSVYLTRKGLILKSSLTITADPGAVLANASAVLNGGGRTITTRLIKNAAKGDISCVVDSVAGLVVGQEVTIADGESYAETLADITAIDEETRTVTFDTSRYNSSQSNKGMVSALTANSSYLMTDFSLVKSVGTIPAVNCTVENITLRPYGNKSDIYIYTISPLNQTRQTSSAQNTLRVRNVTIDGSMHDGISTQGSGDILIENCIVRNVKHKGIHWGTQCDKIIVRGNLCINCGSQEYEKISGNGGTGAMYYCSRNQRVIIEGNRIVDSYKGVFGFDYRDHGSGDTDSVIANNVFDNCAKNGISSDGLNGTGCNLKIIGNVFKRFTGNAVPIDFRQPKGPAGFVISGNTFGEFQDGYVNSLGVIALANGFGIVVSGNIIEKNPAATGSMDISITSSDNVAVSGNVVDGKIDVSDEENVNVLKSNNVEIINEEVK